MKKYNVRITEYYRIDGIEAESLEEAERIAPKTIFEGRSFSGCNHRRRGGRGMKTFEIEIQAIVRKTITVTAKDQDEAVIMITAHEQFNVMNDDVPEEYEQDTVNIKEITA
jgi:hypothetical protein